MSCEALALRNHFSLAVRLRAPLKGRNLGLSPPGGLRLQGGPSLLPVQPLSLGTPGLCSQASLLGGVLITGRI